MFTSARPVRQTLVLNFFPQARCRGIILAAVAVSILSLVAAAPGTADDLHHRRQAVDTQIDRAGQQLDQSSEQVVRAARALAAGQRRLRTARAAAGLARARLAATVAVDAQLRAKLAAAGRALAAARGQVASIRGRIGQQEQGLRDIAVATYQSGDPGLLALSLVLTSKEPAALSGQLNAVDSILTKQAAALDRLQATRVLLQVMERQRAAARNDVARRRAAVAAQLRHRRVLESRARAAAARVAARLDVRRRQRLVAARARSQDLARLHALQRERDRVAALLRRRAERSRRHADQTVSGGVSASNTLVWPVEGWVSSPFGMRFHPVYKRWELHDGLDIAAGCGTPVRAATGGRVVARYYNSAYGNRVIVDHGYRRGVGLGTTYNHLSAFSTFVGQRVRAGEVIGYVGTTGASTGCHLHFMVLENGRPVDPRLWL